VASTARATVHGSQIAGQTAARGSTGTRTIHAVLVLALALVVGEEEEEGVIEEGGVAAAAAVVAAGGINDLDIQTQGRPACQPPCALARPHLASRCLVQRSFRSLVAVSMSKEVSCSLCD
jgi:hypothetical protein